MTCRSLGETLTEQIYEILWPLGHAHAGLLEGGNLLRGGSRGTRDDRARMAHSPPWRRRLTRDESNDRLLHTLLHETSSLLLVRTADLSHHGHGIGAGIGLERRQAIDEVRAVDRVP